MKRARTYTKKAPVAKARKNYNKIPRELSNDRVHYVKRHASISGFPVSNTVPTLLALQFNLTQVPAFAELTAMYDQYKICGVKVILMSAITSVNTIASIDTPDGNARLLTAIDFNDSTPPTSTDTVREYENCKVTTILGNHERYIPAPKFINSSGQNINDWISTTSPSTAHYGLKIATEAMNSTGTLSFNYAIELVYYLCFKNIK